MTLAGGAVKSTLGIMDTIDDKACCLLSPQVLPDLTTVMVNGIMSGCLEACLWQKVNMPDLQMRWKSRVPLKVERCCVLTLFGK